MRADVITTGLYDDYKQYVKPLDTISNTDNGEDLIIRIAFKGKDKKKKGNEHWMPVYLYKGADLKTAFTWKKDSYSGKQV